MLLLSPILKTPIQNSWQAASKAKSGFGVAARWRKLLIAGRPVFENFTRWSVLKIGFWDQTSGSRGFIQEKPTVLNGSNKWDWDKLTELRPDPGGDPASADWQIIKALENDQDGIAVANLNFVSSEEPLALAERPGEPFYSLTKENLFQRR